MVSIQVKAHVGPDGILRLQVPAEFRDTDVEARVELQPAPTNGATVGKDERGWPVGFFEATAGAWAGELE
jgi:hypothetical protein